VEQIVTHCCTFRTWLIGALPAGGNDDGMPGVAALGLDTALQPIGQKWRDLAGDQPGAQHNDGCSTGAQSAKTGGPGREKKDAEGASNIRNEQQQTKM